MNNQNLVSLINKIIVGGPDRPVYEVNLGIEIESYEQ